MSFSVLEQLRSAHEDIENIEKAMSLALMDKHLNQKNSVHCDHALKHLIETAQQKCKTAAEIYQDKDGMRADDINALAGVRSDKKLGDVWTSFYDKVKEVKDYHRKFSVNQGLPEVQNAKWFLEHAFQSDRSEALFSGEEDLGKRVDMNEHYVRYINLKTITNYRKKRFREQTFARMRKKTPDLEMDDPIVDQAIEREYHELDYVQWLKEFDQFHDIPRHCKYKDAEYTRYLDSVVAYLRDFLLRTQPIVGLEKLEAQFEKEFEERWTGRNIPGWQEPTHKSKLFCLPTQKLFQHEGIMNSHKSGKLYKQKVAHMQQMSFEEQNQLVEKSEAEDKRIAKLESRAGKWHDLLSETISETVAHLQKKQSQTAEEMAMDDGASDSDGVPMDEDGGVDIGSDDEAVEDRPIYNPLNLPLGWDGKPIPFWLYKLHGLGIEYKCEICGNYSYWGRRAFEKHFQEWRHAFGMRCLKIPNTSHFKEITKIEEAITLYEKLKKDADEQTFRPDADVECEDIQGNVMSQKAFEDLRRQGLV